MQARYDLVVLGQGAAAFASAIKASELKAKVAMVGYNATKGTRMGGTCVNVGCVPSKALLTAGEIYWYGNHGFNGIQFDRKTLNLKQIVNEKDEMVDDFRKNKYKDVLKNLGIDYYEGEASFASPKTVNVNGNIISAEKFVVATGAHSSIPAIEGVEKVDYLTNEEALHLQKVPESMLIVGAGPVGIEFAQMYTHFDSKVTVLQKGLRILPREEPEISEALEKYLQEEGTRIYKNTQPLTVTKKGSNKLLTAKVNGKKKRFKAEELLLAVGRTPHTKQIGLDRAGVKTDDKGFILINNTMQTTAPHIYAAGDCCGEPMLETTAAKEGAIASENALSGAGKKMDYSSVPHAVFTSPQVASVGMTDQQAVAAGYKCTCRILGMESVPKSHIIKDTRGLIKMVTDSKTKRILGIHILAPHAADLIHAGVFIVRNRLTVDDVIDTVFNFPTLSEAIKMTAQMYYKDVTKLSCCIE